MRGSAANQRSTSIAAALAALCTAGLLAYGATPRAQAADQAPAPDVTAYDAGYASEAGSACPGVVLSVEITAETKANPDFKRGQDMFKRYVESLKSEGACKVALKLYDASTGKVAKVLRQK